MALESELRETLLAAGIEPETRASATLTRDPALRASIRLSHIVLSEPGGGRPELPDLEVLGTLGTGGMGVVELARQPSLDRDVALKRVRPDRAAPSNVERLLREARIAGRLEHPNIVPVHMVGLDAEGLPIVVMKRISGRSWADEIRSGKRTLGQHIATAIQVCQALHFAHRRGVVHRDVKPDNVMLGEFGEVYVLDWGIAVDLERDGTSTREPIGTPECMAPEMTGLGPAKLGPCTDVYLLGAALHQAVVGRPRHAGQTVVAALMNAHQSLPHTYGAEVPRELANVLNRACARDAQDRFESALALQEALAAFLEHSAARDLTRVGAARARELDALLEGLGPDEREPEACVRLYDEASFAFQQALRIWPEDEDARRERRALAERLFDSRVSRADAGGAAALVQALDPQDSVRREASRALEERLETERARLENLEHDRDPSVGRAPRLVLLGALFGLVLGTAAYSRLVHPAAGESLSDGEYVGIAALIFAGLASAIAAQRRRFMANELSRALTLQILTGLALLVVGRVASVWLLHLERVAAALLDLMVVSGMTAALALRVPRLWILVMLQIPTCLALAAWPDNFRLIANFGALASAIGIGLALRFARRT